MSNAIAKTENVTTLQTVSRPDPLQMLGMAIERGMSVSDLAPLMDLVERDQANKARVSFMAAMAEFQATCPTIKKSSKGHNSNFAGLDEIFVTIQPHLAAAGLAVRFDSETGEGKQTAICYVSHRDGHVEQSRFTCPIDSKMAANDSQKAGSANSYAKRYALCNALNLVGSEFDDDAFSAGQQQPAIEMATDEQLATIAEYRQENQIPPNTLEWLDKQESLTKKQAVKLITMLIAANK